MEIFDLQRKITAIPRPSGYEIEAKKTFIELVSPFVDNCTEDIHGNVIATKYGKTDKTIMLTAHIDEIGMVITYIEDNGFIRFNIIGGGDLSLFPGRSIIINHKDKKTPGVIGSLPIHLRKHKTNNCSEDLDASDLWIDIGTNSKEETEQYVSVGDYAVFNSSLTSLHDAHITSRGLDDSVGVVTLIEIISKLPKDLDYTICLVASIQEEIGLRGAMTATYTVQPNICIAIDVTHATDYPSINKSKYGDIRLGKGCVIPYGADMTPSIQEKLRFIAQNEKISFQTEVCPKSSGTDIHAIQVVRGGCATGLISIPCRYMHTPVEVVSTNDIQSAIDILIKFCTTTI